MPIYWNSRLVKNWMNNSYNFKCICLYLLLSIYISMGLSEIYITIYVGH